MSPNGRWRWGILLGLWLLPGWAMAHVYWIIPGTLVVRPEAVTLTIRCDASQTMSLAGVGRMVTRGDVALAMPVLQRVFSERLTMLGAPPIGIAYLPDLLQQIGPDSDKLPDEIVFVVMWSGLPIGVNQPYFQARLFAGQPVLATMQLQVDGVAGVTELHVPVEGYLPLELSEHGLVDSASASTSASANTNTNTGSPSTNRLQMIRSMIGVGFRHIIPEGLDHVLFVCALLLAHRAWRPILMDITAFTVAHGITLTAVVLDVVRLGQLASAMVEFAIAASIVIAAGFAAWAGWRKPGPEGGSNHGLGKLRWLFVACLGLIHGFGFAGILLQYPVVAANPLTTLTAFHVGVELGQLTVIALAGAGLVWWWQRPWYGQRVVVPLALGLMAVASWWMVDRGMRMLT